MNKTERYLVIASILAFPYIASAQNKKKVDFEVGGWFELTKGIQEGNNLRLYPSIKLNNLETSSLIDINNFFPFSKNDFKYKKAKVNLGKHTSLSPLLTLHTRPEQIMGTIDLNMTTETDNYFGLVEIDVNPLDPSNTEFFIYQNLGTKIGNFGFFSTGKLRDIKSAYNEVEYTSKDLFNSGVSFYSRVNLMRKVKPTYQVGISVNPKKVIKKFNRRPQKR